MVFRVLVRVEAELGGGNDPVPDPELRCDLEQQGSEEELGYDEDECEPGVTGEPERQGMGRPEDGDEGREVAERAQSVEGVEEEDRIEREL